VAKTLRPETILAQIIRKQTRGVPGSDIVGKKTVLEANKLNAPQSATVETPVYDSLL
jgi:hypothetical protein